MKNSLLVEANNLVRLGDYKKARDIYVHLQKFSQPGLSLQMSIDFCNRKISGNSGAQSKSATDSVHEVCAQASHGCLNSQSSNKFAISLIRILGNSIDGLHSEDQYLQNMEFQLSNEHSSDQVEKIWLLNRIVDGGVRKRIVECLRDYRTEYLEIPYDSALIEAISKNIKSPPSDIASQSYGQRLRFLQVCANQLNSYVMNNNGARNFALISGRLRARWVLPFDGNIYINGVNFKQLLDSFLSRDDYGKIFTCPMARVSKNDLNEIESIHLATEEPQLMFGCLSTALFDERFVYGRRPKVEMLWRLGVPGVWDSFVDDPHDPVRNCVNLNALYGGHAFSVVRLGSGGDERAITYSNKRNSVRSEGVARFLSRISPEYRGVVKSVCPELLD